MSLIKCPDCGKAISDTVDACPKCGYKFTEDKKRELNRKAKQGTKMVLLGMGLLFALILICVFNGNKETPETPEQKVQNKLIDDCGGFHDARNAAKEFVTKQMISPSNTKFIIADPLTGAVNNEYFQGDCKFMFEGEVDTQNRNGAIIRLQYSVVVQNTEKQWNLVSINMQ